MKRILVLLALSLPFATAVCAAGDARAARPSAAELATGKAIYEKACAACHASGVLGAPKTGDKSAWKAHIDAGMDHLFTAALKGAGKMPPKGGNAALSDAEVRAAVLYMVEQGR